MIERTANIETDSGNMETFICHPERNGPHPVILFFMDAPGIREELRDMVRRIASVGYYVMLPNLYYRLNVLELGPMSGDHGIANRERAMQYMDTLTMPMVMSDADELVAYASSDADASRGSMGTLGYCMSGRYAMGTAVRHRERVKAAASIYGTKLVTDAQDSPHLTARDAWGELYFACAENDHYVPLSILPTLEQSLKDGLVKFEIELYNGVDHGFAFPGRAAYNRDAAERHWERILSLFRRNL